MEVQTQCHREMGLTGDRCLPGGSGNVGQRRQCAKRRYGSMGKLDAPDPELKTHDTQKPGVSGEDRPSSFRVWDAGSESSEIHGGIFGMDFSPDGSTLAVACEQKSVLIFDPLRAKFAWSMSRAHDDCVNSVRFLDNRMLASCSDDHSVRLWDLRFSKSPLKSLRAHRNWVKNIEFVKEKGLLLSSAFDGYIYGWNINDPQFEPKRMFYTPGLMRMRLTPDSSKMILSTQWGYLLAIHNLDFETLPTDLFGFKPNMFWLMVKSGTEFQTNQDYLNRFTAAKNRTELILDFPEGCDPENISSISPHPEGWCFASRSSNHDEQSEWTCIHDLQLPAVETWKESERSDERESTSEDEQATTSVVINDSPRRGLRVNVRNDLSNIDDTRILVESATNSSPQSSSARSNVSENIITLQMSPGLDSSDDDTDFGAEGDETESRDDVLHHINFLRRNIADTQRDSQNNESEVSDTEPSTSSAPSTESPNPSDSSHPSRRLRLRTIARPRRGVRVNLRNSQANTQISIDMRRDPRALSIRSGPPGMTNRTIFVLGNNSTRGTATADSTTVPTFQRLGYYQEEPRMGRGFIKEQSWSNDGRVLASPFGFGVRLLGFRDDCADLSEIYCPRQKATGARPMTEISSLVKRHSSVVLCTKFSPTHCLLVTGCLKGRLVFSQPVL